ncbi:Bug family tripartite tricarboxylate transporter substrate binding protein [Bordetella genomosp. 4]|nr:tripartite tricarboxylate transporter substrate-binding protein [Bordetella genomosp. 4]
MMARYTPLSILLHKTLAIAASTCLLALSATSAHAQDYPSQSIRMIVPFGPGTSTDTVARIMANAMAESLGKTIVVENKAGAGGTIGTEQVARTPADGYTIVMGTVGTHAINKTLYKKLGYDPVKDFVPIGLVGQTPTLLVVKADSPLRSLSDLATAAAKPGGISFGSAGNGTSGHLAGELLKLRLGGEMTHVPYKEGGMAVTDVISGQTQFMFYHPAATLPHIKSGKLRALGSSGATRSASAPDVPTIAEQTGKDFDLVAWFMIYTPAATPTPVIETLQKAARAALSNQDVAAKLGNQGIEQRPLTAEELRTFTPDEISKWAELVTQSGAQID